jgi:hypothetical protein
MVSPYKVPVFGTLDPGLWRSFGGEADVMSRDCFVDKGARLIFVLNSLGVGGSESKVIKTVNALVRSGCSAEIAFLNPPETLKASVDPAVRVSALRRRGK